MDIYFTLQSFIDGSLMSGLASSTVVHISKDGGAFAQTTNNPSEIGGGVYKVTLTSTEAQFSTLIYKPICTDAQENVYIIDAEPSIPTASENATAVWGASTRTVTNTIPSASDNASAVWGALTRTLTASPTDISGLATTSALSSVASNVSAVKAKTDNLPSNPAATGDAMTLTSAYDAAKTASQFDASTDTVEIGSTSISSIQSGLATSSELSSLESHGDSNWATATGFATVSDLTGLSTFDPANDTVTIDSTQAATMITATGFATPNDISGLATATDLSTLQSTAAGIKAKTDNLPSSPAAVGSAMTLTSAYDPAKTAAPTAQDIWEYTTRTLTSSGSGGATAQEVWEYPGDRTLTGAVTLTADYNAAKTAAKAGDAMTLTSAYDKAKTAAAPGDEMTLTSDYDACKTAAPTAVAVASAVWSETSRTITGIPSTVTDLLNQLHALLGDWTMGQTTLTTSEGNYTLTRDNDGNIIAVTPSSQGS